MVRDDPRILNGLLALDHAQRELEELLKSQEIKGRKRDSMLATFAEVSAAKAEMLDVFRENTRPSFAKAEG